MRGIGERIERIRGNLTELRQMDPGALANVFDRVAEDAAVVNSLLSKLALRARTTGQISEKEERKVFAQATQARKAIGRAFKIGNKLRDYFHGRGGL